MSSNLGDTTPCRMTRVTLHSHVHYKEPRRGVRGVRAWGAGRAVLSSKTRRGALKLSKMVLESQFPHKIVNLLLTTTYSNNTLTVLWGG